MGKASSATAATKTTTTTTTTTITSSRTATTTTTATTTSAAASAAKSSGGLLNRMKRKKKKGRPSLLDLQRRQLQQQKQQEKRDHLKKVTNHNTNKTLTPPSSNYNSSSRRSTRRNPNPTLNYDYSPSSFEDDDDDDDDDDERQQKKVKLVVRLPQSSSEQGHPREFPDSPSRNSPPSSSAAPSDSEQDNAPQREINAGDVRSNLAGLDQGGKNVKMMDTVHGSSLRPGPTSTPLPDKTMLVFVLDRLQKKDTYGVFSEPVDPNELPDYHEIIQHPMDFGTVRKRLDGGVYTNLEQLEADVMLICSNAMQYNSSDTVYYRQARAIQELARRDFENLRNEGDNGEPQPKIVRRGRPPSKNLKKPIESSPTDRVGLEVSSGAMLATGEDKTSGSNGYNLRKGQSMLYKFRSNDPSGTSFRSRNGENYSDWLVDWNSEFPANILRADMKYGKKHFSMIDETRRDTYKQSHPSPSSSKPSYFTNALGDMKRLMSVGLHMDPHAYARSLARYAANLGPVAWNVASRKLKSVLPDGLAFGPGWVEENDSPLPFSPEKLKPTNSSVVNHDYNSKSVNPSTPELSAAVHRPSGDIVEAGRRLGCQSELPGQGGGLSWATQASGSSFQTPPQKNVFHPNRNGFNGMFGFDMSSQMGVAQLAANQPGHSGWDNQILLGRQSAGGAASSLPPGPSYQPNSEESKLSDNWVLAQSGGSLNQASGSSAHMVSTQHRQHHPGVPPDLNIRVQATSGSPSSSLQIGSPPPDLALQL